MYKQALESKFLKLNTIERITDTQKEYAQEKLLAKVRFKINYL